jgi:hypothetical protein
MFIPAPLDISAACAERESLLGGNWSIAPLAAGPIIYLLTVCIVHGRRRFERTAGARKRRGALARAMAVLRRGKKGTLDSGDASRCMCAAIRCFLADRFDVSELAITPADARRILSSEGIDATLVDALCNIMERNFNVDYRSSSSLDGDTVQDYDETARLLAEVDEACAEHDARREHE